MHDAGLQGRVGKDRGECLAHPLEPIGDRNQDVLAAARLEIAEHLHPEFRAFCVLDPQAEDVAAAVREHREREVDGLAADRRFLTNLDPQRIEEHHRIHPLEGPALPRRHFGDDAVGHRADQIRRDLHGVHLREKALNLAHRHPARIEREDLVVKAGKPPLMLGKEPRLEGARAVARHADAERPIVGQHGLAARPIAMIGGVLRLAPATRIPQMVGELAAEGPLDNRFLEPPNRGLYLLSTGLVEGTQESQRGTGASGASGIRLFCLRRCSPHPMPHTQNS